MADSPYVLTPRTLSEADLALLDAFSCGDRFWEQDVDDFLRRSALDYQRRGYAKTTLFFLEDYPEVVGFLSVSPKALICEEFARHLPKRERPTWTQIPAVYIAYAGVHRDFQGGFGVGEEIHTRLLRQLLQGFIGPRWLFLHVYRENPSVRFWERLGYEFLDADRSVPRRDNEERELLRLVLDLKGQE